jgi:hypothetical protein
MKNLTNKPDSPLSNDPLIREHLASHDFVEVGVIVSLAMSLVSLIISAGLYFARG